MLKISHSIFLLFVLSCSVWAQEITQPAAPAPTLSTASPLATTQASNFSPMLHCDASKANLQSLTTTHITYFLPTIAMLSQSLLPHHMTQLFSVMPLVHLEFCPNKGLRITNRKALVIGNTEYTQAPLVNPENDARAIAESLRVLGFQVDEHHNLDLKAMRKAVRAFEDSLNVDDIALVFYAGHGAEVDGENYLIPTDANFYSGDDVEDEAFPLERVLDSLDDAQARLKIIILDACRDNPFKGQRGGGGLAEMKLSRNFRPVANNNEARGTFIAFATSPEETASDGGRRNHSPYTAALLQHINTPDIEIEEVFKRVREDVVEHTNYAQHPWDRSNLLGDFVFNNSAPSTAIPSNKNIAAPVTDNSADSSDEYFRLGPAQNAEEALDLLANWLSEAQFYGKISDVNTASDGSFHIRLEYTMDNQSEYMSELNIRMYSDNDLVFISPFSRESYSPIRKAVAAYFLRTGSFFK